MAIPKSEKLKKEEESREIAAQAMQNTDDDEVQNTGLLKIKPVRCLNEYVAILKRRVKTSIVVSNDADMFEQEGIVVGIGPGLPDNCGGRVATQLQLGDVVLISPKTPVAGELLPKYGEYAGQKIVIVQERSLLCIMSTKVEFEIVSDEVMSHWTSNAKV